MNGYEAAASHGLDHYVRQVFESCHLHWDGLNEGDMCFIVSNIVRAAVEIMRAEILVAAGAKEPTHQALVDADLLPATLTAEDVRETAQAALRRIGEALGMLYDSKDLTGDVLAVSMIVENEALALDAFCGLQDRTPTKAEVLERILAAGGVA